MTGTDRATLRKRADDAWIHWEEVRLVEAEARVKVLKARRAVNKAEEDERKAERVSAAAYEAWDSLLNALKDFDARNSLRAELEGIAAKPEGGST
jgi:hypothetical protein